MITWNAVLGYDTFERLAEMPQKAETVTDVRGRHITRMLADGLTHSVLDAFSAQVPYYCYLGYALGDYGIMPLNGRFKLRWYPVKNVQELWGNSPAASKLTLAKTISRIERKYGVNLKRPPTVSLP